MIKFFFSVTLYTSTHERTKPLSGIPMKEQLYRDVWVSLHYQSSACFFSVPVGLHITHVSLMVCVVMR